MKITKALPTIDAVLELEAEELAAYLLEHLQPLTHALNRNNFLGSGVLQHYENNGLVERALMEAWSWLVREGLIVQQADGDGWFFVSRRGDRLKGRQDLAAFQNANILPRASLHPVIAEKVWSAFARGEYDTAVFQAFREVEVATRSAGGHGATEYGVDLVGNAFNVTNGPLADQSLPQPERKAVLHLFLGAVGLFKNPSSHRHMTLTDPREAAEIIGFASLLMRIVDSASARGK